MTYLLYSWSRLLCFFQATSVFVLAFMMLSICYDSLMRYVFFSPTSWSLEINSFLLVYLAVIGAAETQSKDAHIRITFFESMMPPYLQTLSTFIISLVGISFSIVMAWKGGVMAWQAAEYGERVSSGFGTPLVLPYALIPVGFIALSVQFLPGIFKPVMQIFKATKSS